jgi:hypothetical protein
MRMDKKNQELIEKGLNLITIYLKNRIIVRVSIGFIGGGISILGFSNLVPYLTVLIRPELVDKIRLENTGLMIVGITMIVIGALMPVFVKIFNHFRDLYINDLERINEIYQIYDQDTFSYHINRISNNNSIFNYEINKIEDLFYLLLKTDFTFNDKKANEIIKKFGNELNEFNSQMGLRVSPAIVTAL